MRDLESAETVPISRKAVENDLPAESRTGPFLEVRSQQNGSGADRYREHHRSVVLVQSRNTQPTAFSFWQQFVTYPRLHYRNGSIGRRKTYDFRRRHIASIMKWQPCNTEGWCDDFARFGAMF